MSQTSGFFNAEVLSDGSYDRAYVAEQFADYFSRFIGNGVFVTPASQLKVVSNAGRMGIVVHAGDAYINGYWYRNDADYVLPIDNANGSSKRLDAIVLRWDSSTRSIYLAVKKGNFNADPILPIMQRDADVYELYLASVLIGPAVTEIKDADITDLRNNNKYCGYVTGVVSQIDTTNLFSQFTSSFNVWFESMKKKSNYNAGLFTDLFTNWFNTIKGQLSTDASTKLQNQIDLLTNVMYDFEEKTTHQEKDGTITETFSDGRKIVTTQDGNEIMQQYYDADGVVRRKKITTVDEKTGDIVEKVYYDTITGGNIFVPQGIKPSGTLQQDTSVATNDEIDEALDSITTEEV